MKFSFTSPDNLRHLPPLFLHISHQLKLGSGSVQIMSVPVNFEINVSVQKIRQEANAALLSHKLCAHWTHFDFQIRKTTVAHLEISQGKCFEQG